MLLACQIERVEIQSLTLLPLRLTEGKSSHSPLLTQNPKGCEKKESSGERENQTTKQGGRKTSFPETKNCLHLFLFMETTSFDLLAFWFGFSRSLALSSLSQPPGFWVRRGGCEEFPSVSIKGRCMRDWVSTLLIWQANSISLDAS